MTAQSAASFRPKKSPISLTMSRNLRENTHYLSHNALYSALPRPLSQKDPQKTRVPHNGLNLILPVEQRTHCANPIAPPYRGISLIQLPYLVSYSGINQPPQWAHQRIRHQRLTCSWENP